VFKNGRSSRTKSQPSKQEFETWSGWVERATTLGGRERQSFQYVRKHWLSALMGMGVDKRPVVEMKRQPECRRRCSSRSLFVVDTDQKKGGRQERGAFAKKFFGNRGTNTHCRKTTSVSILDHLYGRKSFGFPCTQWVGPGGEIHPILFHRDSTPGRSMGPKGKIGPGSDPLIFFEDCERRSRLKRLIFAGGTSRKRRIVFGADRLMEQRSRAIPR